MNYVELVGVITHTEAGYDGLTRATLEITRTSGTADAISIRYPNYFKYSVGCVLAIKGQLMTQKRGKHRDLYVFANHIEMAEEDGTNRVDLDGTIAKIPAFRYTPKGREIADVTLKNEEDYIPLVFWGRNARFISSKEAGEHIKVRGRIQSREYTKHYRDGTEQIKTAYEISVDKIEG